MKTTQCVTTSADMAAPSIFGILFKQNMSDDSPQEEEQPNSNEEKHVKQNAITHPTVLADLQVLQQLSKQLQVAIVNTSINEHDKTAAQSMTSIAKKNDLASLYCRRAAALLTFANYDATMLVPLDILAVEASVSNPLLKETNQSAEMLEAVQQALKDAQAAAALASDQAILAEAHLLSAYCSRSLGEISNAQAFTALAASAFPDNAAIKDLAEQLDVEARTELVDLVPRLRMTFAKVSTLATADAQALKDMCRNNGENNDQPDQCEIKMSMPLTTTAVEQNAFWSQVAPHFQVFEVAAHSSWLNSLARLLHLNVHHCCALPHEARQLDAALQATFAILAHLLRSKAACSTFNLNMSDDSAAKTVEKLTQAAAFSTQSVVQNRIARNWIVQMWAPAVRRVMISTDQSPLIDLSCDVLMMLARLLQASGSLRQCTSMSHSLAYAQMGYNLAKAFCDVGNHGSLRLEIQCAEAYALALLQRANDYEKALMKFHEMLQVALNIGDQEYELRSRFHVVKTLRILGKEDIAHAELVLLLERSRSLNDVHMEAIAEYEMGKHFILQDDTYTALEHFRAAQALCNRTANCADSWRAASIQQAIAFYARLRPIARRGAIRCSASSLFVPTDDEENNDVESEFDGDEKNDKREDVQSKERRRAICIKDASIQPQSLMSTLFNQSDSNSLCGPKPKRTTSWREAVFATAWLNDNNSEPTAKIN
ncbi:putative tetratricopeptide-like helical domain superfamily [Plasmopara halstedii]